MPRRWCDVVCWFLLLFRRRLLAVLGFTRKSQPESVLPLQAAIDRSIQNELNVRRYCKICYYKLVIVVFVLGGSEENNQCDLSAYMMIELRFYFRNASGEGGQCYSWNFFSFVGDKS